MAESSAKFGIILSLKDAFSRGAKNVSDTMKKMKGQATETTGGMNKLGTAINALAGAAVFQKSKQLLGSLIEPAMDFEKSLAMVNSRLVSGGLAIGEVEKRLIGISNEFGVRAAEQAQGLTQILTGGVENADQALIALETSNKLAKANNVSLDTANDVLLRALNTFQLAPQQLAAAGNVIQIAAEAGTGSIQEFSMALEMGGTAVRTVGGNFVEFAAIIGTLRDQGVKGRETISQLEQTIASLQGHEKELKPFLRSIGADSVKSAVQAHGLVPVLDAIINSVKGNRDALGKFGLADKALDNILLITGKNMAAYNANLKKYGTDTETLSNTYAKASDNMSHKLEVLHTRLENTKIAMGKNLLMAMAPVIEKLEEFSQKLFVFLEAHPKFAEALAMSIGILAVLGVALGAVATVVGVLSIALTPLVVILLKVVAVIGIGVAWLYVLYRTSKFVGDSIADFLIKGFRQTGAFFDQFFPILLGHWHEWYDSVIGWVSGILSKVLELIDQLKFMSPLFTGISLIAQGLGIGKKEEAAKAARPEQLNTALSTQTQANTELSAVKNPNVNAGNPGVTNIVNVPPAKIQAAPVMLDKKKLGEIMFEMQQLKTVRATG